MKMKLMKNKKYLQQKFSRKVLVPQTTADFMSRVNKSYFPFTCKFPIVMHFVPILLKHFRSKTNFYVFSYDKTVKNFVQVSDFNRCITFTKHTLSVYHGDDLLMQHDC